MRHRGKIPYFVIGALLLVAVPAAAGVGAHCAVRLEPAEAGSPGAAAVELGCFPTLAAALKAGSGGSIDVPAGATPSSLTDAVLEVSTEPLAAALKAGSGGSIDLPAGATPSSLTDAVLEVSTEPLAASVLIGTEFDETGYLSSSKSYFASVTCSASVTWEVSYVGDAWNDRFESGKGFGGCDHNRKFAASQFGGSSLLCSPNCTSYGTLNNAVSSLRWRD